MLRWAASLVRLSSDAEEQITMTPNDLVLLGDINWLPVYLGWSPPLMPLEAPGEKLLVAVVKRVPTISSIHAEMFEQETEF